MLWWLTISLMDDYLTPVLEQRFELEVKRSRFVTRVLPVDGRAMAKVEIARIRENSTDANHHCWAMVAGRPNDFFLHDQSDDGEPRGTAGKPMLNVLQHSGLGNTLVVVTRYFGGVKLGAGGLVRAYSGAVSEALQQLVTQPVVVRDYLCITLAYSNLNTLEHRLVELETTIESRDFSEHVQLMLAYPAKQREALIALLETFGASWQDD